jgi:hypothetical protein
VTWGQAFAGGPQPVPPGPVRDALEAVKLGQAQAAQAADWAKLAEELNALLQPPPPEKKPPEPPKQNQPPPKPQNGQSSDQNKSESQQRQEERQKRQQNNPEENSGAKAQSDPGQKPNSPPPAKPGEPKPETQPVGGQPQSERPDPARLDPTLAGSLQKLDRVRDEDSPAQLFQMLANQNPQRKTPPPQHPKNW